MPLSATPTGNFIKDCYGKTLFSSGKGETMKTIAINSIKGGTGKSTLAVLLIKALTKAGFRCLVMDADSSNHSLSFFLADQEEVNPIQDKTYFIFS